MFRSNLHRDASFYYLKLASKSAVPADPFWADGKGSLQSNPSRHARRKSEMPKRGGWCQRRRGGGGLRADRPG
nr:hypothetical protein SHINE37_70095 [Rhizobiaceae bacterium]